MLEITTSTLKSDEIGDDKDKYITEMTYQGVITTEFDVGPSGAIVVEFLKDSFVAQQSLAASECQRLHLSTASTTTVGTT